MRKRQAQLADQAAEHTPPSKALREVEPARIVAGLSDKGVRALDHAPVLLRGFREEDGLPGRTELSRRAGLNMAKSLRLLVTLSRTASSGACPLPDADGKAAGFTGISVPLYRFTLSRSNPVSSWCCGRLRG
jgi:hypothetical protein